MYLLIEDLVRAEQTDRQRRAGATRLAAQTARSARLDRRADRAARRADRAVAKARRARRQVTAWG